MAKMVYVDGEIDRADKISIEIFLLVKISLLPPSTPKSITMATLYPPPSKRQKLVQADKAREQQEIENIPSDLGSVRVQFFDQATGQPTGPAVSVPVADANVKNLETLLNTLQGNVRFGPCDHLTISCCTDGDFFPGG